MTDPILPSLGGIIGDILRVTRDGRGVRAGLTVMVLELYIDKLSTRGR